MLLHSGTGAGVAAVAIALTSAFATAQTAVSAWTPRRELFGDQPHTVLGASIAILGDVSGDGRPDAALGAPTFSAVPGQGPGTVLVVSCSDLTVHYAIHGSAGDDQFGTALGAIDDLDGDGVTDFVVGAPQLDAPGYAQLRSGVDGHLLLTLPTPGGTQSFGASIAGAGDVNADGIPDVVVGDPHFLYDEFSGDYYGGLRVFSGADGSVLLTHVGGYPPSTSAATWPPPATSTATATTTSSLAAPGTTTTTASAAAGSWCCPG